MTNVIEYTSPNYPGTVFDEYELELMFDDHLNEVEGLVTLMGLDYTAAEAIKRVDPIAYREYYFEWLDAEGFSEE